MQPVYTAVCGLLSCLLCIFLALHLFVIHYAGLEVSSQHTRGSWLLQQFFKQEIDVSFSLKWCLHDCVLWCHAFIVSPVWLYQGHRTYSWAAPGLGASCVARNRTEIIIFIPVQVRAICNCKQDFFSCISLVLCSCTWWTELGAGVSQQRMHPRRLCSVQLSRCRYQSRRLTHIVGGSGVFMCTLCRLLLKKPVPCAWQQLSYWGRL